MEKIEQYAPPAIEADAQREKITVVVAVYNIQDYIRRAVDSLLAQTYHNLEIILVDDGSTDQCPAICDAYARADDRVLVIHKKNGGLGSARNAGMELASGEYIAFLDGDDWVEETMYEKLYSCIRDFDAQLAVCRYRQVYADGQVDGSQHFAAVFEGQEMLEQYLKEDEAYKIQNAAWNKLYRRSLADRLRFPAGWYEDLVYTTRLLAGTEKSVYLDEALYNYVCDRPGSIMNAGINDRIFTDLIPRFYEKSAFLRSIGREDLACLHDYALYKRLLLYYTQIVRSPGKNAAGRQRKKSQKAQIAELIGSHRQEFDKIYAGAYANPKEEKKMALFLQSPAIYNIAMYVNDKFVIPLKTGGFWKGKRQRA